MRSTRAQLAMPVALLVVVFGAAVAWRALAPSDLYDNDQPKTVNYTMDMVANGRWLMPQDVQGRPATKPPMVNWIGAPAVWLLGPEPFALRLPAVLSGLAIVLLTVWMGRWIGLRSGLSSAAAWALGLAAGSLWTASTTGVKFVYLIRPDGMLAAWLTGAWACATLLMVQNERRSSLLAGGFWLCVAGAALSKGPVAVIALLYVVLAAKLIVGRWRAVNRVQWWWGGPLVLLLVGGWLWGAWLADPVGFRLGMLGDNVDHRSMDGGAGVVLNRILEQWWQMPGQFLARFAPWSVFFVLAMLHWPPRRWFRSALGPVILWVLLVVGLFMLSPRQRPDYLAPCYGPAAIGAAYWLVVVGAKYRLTAVRVQVLALAIVMGLGIYYARYHDAARTGFGANVVHFADAVERIVGAEPIRFRETGYNTLQAQLGYNQRTPDLDAPWVIQPVGSGRASPVIVSDPIPGWPDGQTRRLGLYRARPENSPDGASGPTSPAPEG